MKLKITSYTCKFCKETWSPRVESPKKCPYCSKYQNKKGSKHGSK